MDTPVSSDFEFLDRRGQAVSAPPEWEPATIVLPIDPGDWKRATLSIQGASQEIVLRKVDGEIRPTADWGLRGSGQWQLTLALDNKTIVVNRSILVLPRKLDTSSFQRLLEDLDYRLIGSITHSLDRMGAFAGARERPPAPATAAEEMDRLRRAVVGDATGPGLAYALEKIADAPHSILRHTHAWRSLDRARAPVAGRLHESLRAIVNAPAWNGGLHMMERVWNAEPYVDHDIFENRVLRLFASTVARRLRFISSRVPETARESSELLTSLAKGSLAARFLDDVGDLRAAPSSPSMVMIRRPEYRIAWRRWLEFNRSSRLNIELAPRSSPIRNAPWLYEVWGALLVIDVLLDACAGVGWRVHRESLFGRADAWFADLNWDGRTIVELKRGDGEFVRVTPQRRFSPSGGAWRSLSFSQVPDLVIEITKTNERPKLLIFDPKYKLVGDTDVPTGMQEIFAEDADAISTGRPVKADIDKMHAYRDAIRFADGCPAVAFAAILFPGFATQWYGEEVAAISAQPLSSEATRADIARIVSEFVA